jgi:hypothetical protein
MRRTVQWILARLSSSFLMRMMSDRAVSSSYYFYTPFSICAICDFPFFSI